MGLRCSLLGHAFGEPVTERERETRGAEVLITVREIRRCSRCDAEQVITENKEIRHLGSEEAGSSAASAGEDQPRAATSGTASDAAGDLEATPDSDLSETGDEVEEPDAKPQESEAGTTEAEADSGEIISDSGDSEEAESEEAEAAAEAETEAEVDVSDLVDAAEEPDAGGPGRSPPVGDTGGDDEESLADEDVEIIDADTEEETPGSAAERTEETGEAREPDSAETGQEPETAADVGEPAPGETEPADAQPAPGDQAEGESTSEEPPETSAEPETADDGPPDDDAIILDNEEGKDARESDVGRRELAGSGNMFDASAPENQGSGTPPSDTSRPDEAGDDAETWPGREVEGRVDESGDSDQGSEVPTEWPTSESVDEEVEASDSAFQFDQDRLEEETEPGRKTPSGLTSEGPVDVAGDPEDSPPKSVECPECGYTAEGVGSSLRAGDICPECHDAYLADRR